MQIGDAGQVTWEIGCGWRMPGTRHRTWDAEAGFRVQKQGVGHRMQEQEWKTECRCRMPGAGLRTGDAEARFRIQMCT